MKKRLSEEHKRKIGLANSIALLGNKANANQLRAMSEGRKKAHKNAKYRKSFLGKKHTEETKKKISRAMKGRRTSSQTEFKSGIRKTNSGTSSTVCHKVARRKMERIYGRKLGFNEVVHHINGDWKDNRIENLCMMSRADHCRLHHKRIGE